VFHQAVDALAAQFEADKIDKIVGIEARGFIFAAALAYKWKKSFIPVRKPGKLPAKTISEEYDLEYGTDKVEMHQDAIQTGDRILIIDDLMATGGTVQACTRLVEKLGGVVAGIGFLIELTFLNGRSRLTGYPVSSILSFDSE
ncbi:MAG: adenine phosphoribosyltransferase, partial [bacterium]|nr:adenine phosphoribosyltransferase [bacterium]